MIKTGDVLIAKKNSYCNWGRKDKWITKNRIYIVKGVDHNGPYIKSDMSPHHYISSCESYFNILKNELDKNIRTI